MAVSAATTKFYKFSAFIIFVLEQDYFKMSSFGEAKFTKLAKSEPQLFNKFNRKFLTRTYPAGKRVDSSNYNPLLAWVVGCQLGILIILIYNFYSN